MGIGVLGMARKRTKGEGAGKGARKSPDATPRETILSIRGRVEWRDWLARAAEYDRSTIVEMIDRAVTRYAREIGFKEPPPER
jgi:hypothetical protein